MSTSVQVFKHEDFGDIRFRIDEEGNVQINAEDAAYRLGYITSGAKGAPRIQWDVIRAILSDFGFTEKISAGSYIPENMFYLLAMRAKNPVAIAFQTWAANEVFPSLRRQGRYAMNEKISRRCLLRELGKGVRKGMTSAACRFYDYSRPFGDTRSKGAIIGQWTNEGYRVTGIPKGGRDDATEAQLAAEILVEKIQRDGTLEGIAQRKVPHRIEASNSEKLSRLKKALPANLGEDKAYLN